MDEIMMRNRREINIRVLRETASERSWVVTVKRLRLMDGSQLDRVFEAETLRDSLPVEYSGVEDEHGHPVKVFLDGKKLEAV